jgi:dynamin 1-like protein
LLDTKSDTKSKDYKAKGSENGASTAADSKSSISNGDDKSSGASMANGNTSGSGANGSAAGAAIEDEFAEWGEFKHKPGVKYFDFEEIRDEINKETDRLLGTKKQVSKVPITLKIYSPYVCIDPHLSGAVWCCVCSLIYARCM